MGQMELHGTDLDAALETVLPADLSLLKGGRLRYSLLLNDEGGIIADLMVTRRGDHFYLVVNGATKHGDIAHIRQTLHVGIKLHHPAAHALPELPGPTAVGVHS